MSSETKNSAGASFDNQIDLEKLHLNSQWSDVNFLFDSGNGTASESIPANKVVLAAQSDVFAAMFYGELKEKGDITVTDASIGAFKEFLQFFHLNRVKLTLENVAEVMDLGHKYNVTKCVDACTKLLMGCITAESACVTLNLAILYEHKDLMQSCEKFMASNSEAVLQSKSFRNSDQPVVAHLLKMDSLSCSETIVFEACLEWIKTKSNQTKVTKQLIQKHLGDLFYDLRFTSMKMKDFDALCTAHDYAFSFAEYKDIMQTLTSMKALPAIFNKNPRKILWNEGAMITCNRKMANSNPIWWNLDYNKPTQFESNQPLLLGTLVFAPLSIFNGSQHVDLVSDLSVDVTIIESLNSNLPANESARTVSNFKISLPSQKETSIKLPTPVRVKPGFNYEIRLNPQQPTVLYQSGPVMAEVKIENDLIIKFHGDRNESGSLNFITGLGFNKM